MSLPVTLSALRTQILNRTDNQNNPFFTTTELNQYINGSYSELYDLLTSFPDSDYNISSFLFTSTSSNSTYPLPSNFYKFRGLDLILNQTNGIPSSITIRPFMFQERNMFNYLYNPIAMAAMGGSQILYRIEGQNIVLVPVPNVATLNFKGWYIPCITPLVSDSDTLDGVNGWEEYIVCDVAVKMAAKEETDPTVWAQGKAMMNNRIESMARDRDTGAPQRVADTVQGYAAGPMMVGGMPF